MKKWCGVMENILENTLRTKNKLNKKIQSPSPKQQTPT
jgi:hypothetical protein